MRKASRSRDGGQEYVEWEVSAVESHPYVEVGQTVRIQGEERRVTAIESVVMRYWKQPRTGELRRRWRANIATSALALALLVSGCVDIEPPGEATETAPPTEEAGGPDIVHHVRPRIELTISTTDPLLPGEDVRLTVHGVAREPIDGGEVVLTLPTRALMDHDGTTALPELPAVARSELPPMAAGETWSASHAVPGEPEGYYRVLVNAYTHGPDGGPWLFDDVFRSAWMWVSETDGRLTPFFEEAVFPEGVHPTTGPRGGWPTAARDTTTELHSDSVYISVVYTVPGNEEFKPAVGAMVWAKPKFNGRWLGSAIVPEDGIVVFKCAKDSENVYVEGAAPATARVQGRSHLISTIVIGNGCGRLLHVSAKPWKYYPWRLLNVAADAITEHFGHSRKMVKWNLKSDTTDRKSKYVRQLDKISLAWGLAGRGLFRFIVAHEYGHAFHHKALGGLFGIWSTPGCGSHGRDKVTSYECALSEGFAHYAGVVGSDGGSPGFDRDCFEYFGESGRPGAAACRKGPRELGDKPKIEGHITALFTDLIDDEEEQGDYTEYPAKYVATVFKTCEKQKKFLVWGKKWYPRSKVPDIVWCLMETVIPAQHEEDSVFGDLDHPLKVREKAEEPDNHDHIRILWTWEKNLK